MAKKSTKETNVRDEKAPALLNLEIKDKDGKVWGTFIANEKEFSSGSVGFYAGEKVTNPDSGKKYQLGCNITLIGSKPPK